MRKIIVHRVNSCKELDSINTSYGVEVDIRTYKNKLVCSHDPLIKGESFKNSGEGLGLLISPGLFRL